MPVLWEQFGEALRGMTGDAGQHVGEPGLRIDVVELGGDDQGRHVGGLFGAALLSVRQWPIVIDIRRFDMPLFFAAMPGSSPGNIDWVRRKSNVVRQSHRSSCGLGPELRITNTTPEERFGLTLADCAVHGRAFSLAVTGVGVIGSIKISGLQQRDDHGLMVRALCSAPGKAERDFELSPAK